MQKLNRFLSCSSGAVTTDWVVLSAVVVGLSIGGMAVISSGTDMASNELADTLADDSTIEEVTSLENANAPGTSFSLEDIKSSATGYTPDEIEVRFRAFSGRDTATLLDDFEYWVPLAGEGTELEQAQAEENLEIIELVLSERGVTPPERS